MCKVVITGWRTNSPNVSRILVKVIGNISYRFYFISDIDEIREPDKVAFDLFTNDADFSFGPLPPATGHQNISKCIKGEQFDEVKNFK